MKKSWKKGIAAAMSVLLAAGMAGCGQTNTANSTATSGDAATTAQTEVAQSNTDNGDLTVVKILGRNYTYTGANGKTVTLKDWSTEGKSKRWDKLSENLAAKGVKLELDLIEPDQFDTTIQTMAASGELFNYDIRLFSHCCLRYRDLQKGRLLWQNKKRTGFRKKDLIQETIGAPGIRSFA